MPEHLRVLLLSSDKIEIDLFQEIHSDQVIVTCARGLPELRDLLKLGSYDALFCSWSYEMGTWDDALQEVHQHSPHVPVIILSRTGGEQEWVQVLEAGGFDLLVPPYSGSLLIAMLVQAVESCHVAAMRNAAAESKERAS